jgi:hypothetical protein
VFVQTQHRNASQKRDDRRSSERKKSESEVREERGRGGNRNLRKQLNISTEYLTIYFPWAK